MPTYEIYRKDGTPVKVKGPEGASTKELVNLYLQEQREKTQRTARERDDLLYERILEAARQKPSTIADQTGEVFKGLGSGVAGLLEQGALGAATVLMGASLKDCLYASNASPTLLSVRGMPIFLT